MSEWCRERKSERLPLASVVPESRHLHVTAARRGLSVTAEVNRAGPGASPKLTPGSFTMGSVAASDSHLRYGPVYLPGRGGHIRLEAEPPHNLCDGFLPIGLPPLRKSGLAAIAGFASN